MACANRGLRVRLQTEGKCHGEEPYAALAMTDDVQFADALYVVFPAVSTLLLYQTSVMSMNREEIILLVRRQFQPCFGDRMHIMAVRPEAGIGWAVYVEYDGIIWKQVVTYTGTLGSCSRCYPQLETIKQ